MDEKFDSHRSFDECLRPLEIAASRELNLFLEDKVLIGGGVDDRLAGQVAAVEVVGNQGGLGEESDHLLHLQPSLFRRGRNGRG